MVTIKDVAEQAGVSIATVSKILNGADMIISEATRCRVRNIINESGYISNSIARGLKLRKTYTLGFILPDITNPYFSEIARGIEDTARHHQYSVIFCNTDDTLNIEQRTLELFKSKMVDGIIFSHVLSGAEKYDLSSVGDTPFVIIDRCMNQEAKRNLGAYGEVYVNTAEAIYDATMRLFQSGCRNIACITAVEGEKYSRYNGYRKALTDKNIVYAEELVYLNEFSVKTGVDGMKAILNVRTDVDGVVCGNDLIAIGVLDVLRERQIAIPEQIRVIGMDNILFSNFTVPRLSTIAQPAYEMGKAAADMLINHIEYHMPLYAKTFAHSYVARETV